MISQLLLNVYECTVCVRPCGTKSYIPASLSLPLAATPHRRQCESRIREAETGTKQREQEQDERQKLHGRKRKRNKKK
jgi:hypothetical protein